MADDTDELVAIIATSRIMIIMAGAAVELHCHKLKKRTMMKKPRILAWPVRDAYNTWTNEHRCKRVQKLH